jgi:hypothetical protein
VLVVELGLLPPHLDLAQLVRRRPPEDGEGVVRWVAEPDQPRPLAIPQLDLLRTVHCTQTMYKLKWVLIKLIVDAVWSTSGPARRSFAGTCARHSSP